MGALPETDTFKQPPQHHALVRGQPIGGGALRRDIKASSIVLELWRSRWEERWVLPIPQRPFELLHQTRKVSALEFPRSIAHDPHIFVMLSAS